MVASKCPFVQGHPISHIFSEARWGFSFSYSSVLVDDNVAYHHATEVVEHTAALRVALLLVPAHISSLNPLDGVFSDAERQLYGHGPMEGSFVS